MFWLDARMRRTKVNLIVDLEVPPTRDYYIHSDDSLIILQSGHRRCPLSSARHITRVAYLTAARERIRFPEKSKLRFARPASVCSAGHESRIKVAWQICVSSLLVARWDSRNWRPTLLSSSVQIYGPGGLLLVFPITPPPPPPPLSFPK